MTAATGPSPAALALFRVASESLANRESTEVLSRPELDTLLRRILALGLISGASEEDLTWALDQLQKEFVTRAGPMRVIEEVTGGAAPWKPKLGPLRSDLRQWLRSRSWTLGMLAGLDEETDGILARIGDPNTPGRWSRAGLVVGQVQSGKTTSYTSVIAGALENGYRAVVILAGRTDDLRDQTQRRIDEGILGRRSSFVPDAGPEPVGVGLLRHAEGRSDWPIDGALLQLTSRDSLSGTTRGGDFSLNRASGSSVRIGGDGSAPLMLAVIKKNPTVLRNLASWFRDAPERLAGGALLVIDDEADDASIDIAAGEAPSTTNRDIRALLSCAERSVYVGYTATPYANILIDPDRVHPTHGRDLFPRDFVALLDPPTTYMGAREFLNPKRGRRHHVEVTDTDAWIQDNALQGPLPRSLVWAVQEFIVASAIRAARAARAGEGRGHASMLVHCNVRTDVQREIAGEITDLIETLKDGWHFPVSGGVPDALQRAWERLDDHQDLDVRVTWAELSEAAADGGTLIGQALEAMEVRQVHSGHGGGRLEYGSDDRTVIAVGGLKLSRGLTLEGLSTSYQLRESEMHDTALQMGRWFGYRPGYEDLCRVHTTPSLLTDFQMILDSDEQLRLDLLDLQEQGARPEQVPLSIAQPDGLRVTARQKMRRAVVVRGSLSARTFELTWLQRADAARNEQHAQVRLAALGPSTRLMVGERDANRVAWDDVPADWVLATLAGHAEPDSEGQLLTPASRAIIAINEARHLRGELFTWRVVLVAGTLPEDPDAQNSGEEARGPEVVVVAGVPCRRFHRHSTGSQRVRFSVVSQPADERFGIGATFDPSGNRSVMKEPRDPGVGLLIGYPLISHPEKEGGEPLRTFSWAVSLPGARPGTVVLGRRAQQEVGL